MTHLTLRNPEWVIDKAYDATGSSMACYHFHCRGHDEIIRMYGSEDLASQVLSLLNRYVTEFEYDGDSDPYGVNLPEPDHYEDAQ